ncbi:hypothetical protein CSPAE12_03964 [Colletotrichum incanum]|nr:hypothetical protein CSPAE12_03964 [Colletotrichum incanum]
MQSSLAGEVAHWVSSGGASQPRFFPLVFLRYSTVVLVSPFRRLCPYTLPLKTCNATFCRRTTSCLLSCVGMLGSLLPPPFGGSQNVTPNPARVSSPTSTSTSDNSFPQRVFTPRGSETEMIPTMRFTVTVCGARRRRSGPAGMSSRSLRWWDVTSGGRALDVVRLAVVSWNESVVSVTKESVAVVLKDSVCCPAVERTRLVPGASGGDGVGGGGSCDEARSWCRARDWS